MEPDKQMCQNDAKIPANSSVFIWGMFFDKQHKIFIPSKVKELEGKDIVEVKSGGLFYLCRTRNGKIYGWGVTKNTKFGLTGEDTLIPRLIPFAKKVKKIAAGNWHSLLIDESGDPYAVGHNKYGSCGTGNFENLKEFTKCQANEKIVQISTGDGISLMITEKGELLSCGHRQRHGHKANDHISKPTKLKFENPIKKVAAGFTHCLAVDNKGKVFSWGDGTFLQLGHGKKDNQKQPKQIKSLNEIFIVDVSCTRGEKYSHSMALDNEGNLYTWGAGYKGKLGHFEEWDHSDPADESLPKKVKLPFKVTKCSAGGIHSMLINENKEAMSFGCGSDGRLGHQESKDHRYLYREGKPRKIEALNDYNVEALQCSYYHNICLVSKKSVI